jgi:hypothetical protein
MSDHERLNLTGLRDEEAVRQAIFRALPVRATPADLLRLAREGGLECSELVDDVITCSSPAPSTMPLVSAKWLITARFADGHLADLSVCRGYIGL